MEQVLTKVRLLQYSKAKNLLRSPGLARQPLEEVVSKLKIPQSQSSPLQPNALLWSTSLLPLLILSQEDGSLNKYILLLLAQH